MARRNRDRAAEDDPLPDGTEHVVVIHRYYDVTGSRPESDRYYPGEELPISIGRSSYRAHGDRLACLGPAGQRLDRRHNNERRDYAEEAERAIEKWRRQADLGVSTRKVYVCERCGEEFDGTEALQHHMSDHVSDDEGADPAGGGDAPETSSEDVDEAAPAFRCSECDNEFASQQALNGHMRAHADAESETDVDAEVAATDGGEGA